MKNEDILNALNYLPDEMIEQAAKGRSGYGKKKITVAARFLKPVLAVASFALVFGVSIFAMTLFGVHTADEAAPEASNGIPSDTANEILADKKEFDWQFSDIYDDANASEKVQYSTNADMTVTAAPEASDIVVEGVYPVCGAPVANITFTDGGIALRGSNGNVLSHIDLRDYSDSTEISVGTITINYSKKNIKSVNELLSLMEKSPVITPDSTAESENECMATLHFYVSDGWSIMADSVNMPLRIEMQLLSRGFVRISVDGYSSIHIAVDEEAITEFTNGLEYLVVND